METMAVSKFKAHCLAVLKRVRKTRKPLLITRFGEPVAEIVPPSAPRRSKGWMGSLRGTAEVVGDIVAPAAPEEEWETLRS
ncbi:MAG: type II toxin-antitoxin system Phd/YefM family antitoxin [Planctomycetes bacterium]|nr:type II toxin-antitoxin system Phd/YefM family antitoxin [Planctomycetota bacterium]